MSDFYTCACVFLPCGNTKKRKASPFFNSLIANKFLYQQAAKKQAQCKYFIYRFSGATIMYSTGWVLIVLGGIKKMRNVKWVNYSMYFRYYGYSG